jgi:hypothetical protein
MAGIRRPAAQRDAKCETSDGSRPCGLRIQGRREELGGVGLIKVMDERLKRWRKRRFIPSDQSRMHPDGQANSHPPSLVPTAAAPSSAPPILAHESSPFGTARTGLLRLSPTAQDALLAWARSRRSGAFGKMTFRPRAKPLVRLALPPHGNQPSLPVNALADASLAMG